MKFVLKVLALVCLIVMSKMAKDEALVLQNPVTNSETSTSIFTSNNQEAPDRSSLTNQRSPLSVKIEKSSLHF